MELVNEQHIIGWELPKNVQILMTNNPDNGEYSVQSTDSAQASRYSESIIKWSVDDWALWSEGNNRDSRCINFVLANPELFENKKQDGLSSTGQVAPRMMDKFFDIVSTIDNFSGEIDYIKKAGEGMVGNLMTNMFIKFVHNKLDLLPTPKKLIEDMEVKAGKSVLTEVCGNYELDPSKFKNSSASVLAIRLANYAVFNELNKKQAESLGEYVAHSSFTEDQKFMMVKRLSKSKNAFKYIMANKKLVQYLNN